MFLEIPFFILQWEFWKVNFISSVFSLESGYLLPSLSSYATYDRTSGSASFAILVITLQLLGPLNLMYLLLPAIKSMSQMLNLHFSMESIFSYKVLLPLFTAPPLSLFLPPTFFLDESLPLFYWFLLDFMELQLPNFQHSPQQHLHKVVRDLDLFILLHKTSQFSNLCSTTRLYSTHLTFNHPTKLKLGLHGSI
jgi:hypothetical protein